MIAVADADHQRAAGSGADHTARLLRRDHSDGVGAVELGDRRPHRAQQIAATSRVPVRVDEMRDHLGVGLRGEDVARGLEALAQRLVILDDAVVHDGDLAVGDMRMRVGRRRRAMRRPPRVRDPGVRRERPCIGLRREIGDAQGADEPLEVGRGGIVADDREAGRVVAAVLEPSNAVDQDGDDVPCGRRTDNAAHGVSLSGISVS